MKYRSFPVFRFLAASMLLLAGVLPQAQARVPVALQGNYHLQSVVVTVNRVVHRVHLSAAAKAYAFPVTADSLAGPGDRLLYAQFGLHWSVHVRKTSATQVTATVSGDFHLPGTRAFIQRGTLAIRLTPAGGGMLTYHANLHGYRQRGQVRQQYDLGLTISLQHEAD